MLLHLPVWPRIAGMIHPTEFPRSQSAFDKLSLSIGKQRVSHSEGISDFIEVALGAQLTDNLQYVGSPIVSVPHALEHY